MEWNLIFKILILQLISNMKKENNFQIKKRGSNPKILLQKFKLSLAKYFFP